MKKRMWVMLSVAVMAVLLCMQPALADDEYMYVRTLKTRDDDIIQEEFLDEDMNHVNGEQGYAIVVHDYDEDGYEIS